MHRSFEGSFSNGHSSNDEWYQNAATWNFEPPRKIKCWIKHGLKEWFIKAVWHCMASNADPKHWFKAIAETVTSFLVSGWLGESSGFNFFSSFAWPLVIPVFSPSDPQCSFFTKHLPVTPYLSLSTTANLQSLRTFGRISRLRNKPTRRRFAWCTFDITTF